MWMRWSPTWCASGSSTSSHPKAMALRLRWPWRCVALLVALLLVGCEPADPARAMLDDYRARVARVLEVEAPPLAQPALPAWPRRRQRQLEVAAQRTGLMKFLSLHQCDLGTLVGQRSSPLGRVMTDEQRLRYEYRFLVAAEACLLELAATDARPQLRANLTEVVAGKRQRLPELMWNATLGHDALAANHALDVIPLAPDEAAEAGRGQIAALHQLADRVAPGRVADALGDDWMEPWKSLEKGRFGGRSRLALAELRLALAQVATMLEQRAASRPLCPQETATPRAQTLHNVFTRYYARVVQPYLADVHRGQRRWRDALSQLFEAQQLAAIPAPMGEFRDTVLAQEWLHYEQARQRHTQAWQNVLERCGLAPQQPQR